LTFKNLSFTIYERLLSEVNYWLPDRSPIELKLQRMKACQLCNNQNLDSSRFCNECGTRLMEGTETAREHNSSDPGLKAPNFVAAQVTSIGVPPLVEPLAEEKPVTSEPGSKNGSQHARLVIERGEGASTEFPLSGDESNIGRWDADNGIFPDVDLDAFDPDAKVSRRHARILRRDRGYFIEDLGSTNGTFVNRGRRLLPGSPQVLSEGDEIIVGKTFLRFYIN
jgi:hypothetical protein